MPTLFESDRLFFRQFTINDGDLLCDLNSDPEVVKYVHEAPTTKENVQNIIKNIILPQYEKQLGRWAVYIKANNEFIGWAGLKYINEKNVIDLGYRFMKRYWGNGYATEAALACIKFGFENLGLQKIVAQAHVKNTASLNVIEKCGMRFIKEDVVEGCPVKIYELLRGKPEN